MNDLPVAVLDACVLYPAPIRDLLLNLADFDLFIPRWTDEIQKEWTRNLLANRPDLSETQLNRTIKAMDEAFPESSIQGYESLIDSLSLPDPNDRHVVAAAIYSKADVVVTANLADFPNSFINQFGIQIQHPDYFIANLIHRQPAKGVEAFKRQVSFLKNPPMTEGQILEIFSRIGLTAVSAKLSEMI
ncbi:PIN domain-containing protein [Salmonirosea aquatica]|uniref:PIN domain-containing protein n=1 Tax=Salmonirosea aquatica TaxID=2654236 RepID=A0A7C9FZ16_9BACT|nr:PIN domain-containing protein [Cytophagaceae bacterium SJW1-29]